MRVTAEQKNKTRNGILDAAANLFRTSGYDATTTRDIAIAADIATGTVFNYFPTKEAIVSALVEAVLDEARSQQAKIEADTLEEALFALVAVELRRLKPHRKYIAALLATTLSPLANTTNSDSVTALRVQHLELATILARQRGFGEMSSIALQLYWTLYTGVLAYWAADKSPKQEDTLALLDQSLDMFVAWLRTDVDASH